MTGQTVEQSRSDVGALAATIGIPTENRARKVTSKREGLSPFTIILLAATAILFAIQLTSLYTTPRPDCDRWHGDETWLMREFQTQMTEGVMRYPEAVGATIGTRNSLPVSSMWLNAAVYGLPAKAFFPTTDLVTIGRTVTACVTLILLVALYLIACKLGARSELAATVLLLLVGSRTFLLASHSARYDIWVGCGVLLVWYVIQQLDEKSRWGTREWLFVGALVPLMLVWNIHVLRVAGLLVAWPILTNNRYRDIRGMGIAAATLLISSAALVLTYYLFNGVLSGVVELQAHSQFDQVTQNIPILHPFSPQLQFANIHTRLYQFASEAPLPLILFLFTLVSVIFTKDVGRRKIISLTALVLLSWAMTLRPLPYYDLQVLPVLLVACTVILSRQLKTGFPRAFRGLCAAIGVLAICLSLRDQSVAVANGQRLTAAVQAVSRQVKGDIRSAGFADRPTILAEVPLINSMLGDSALRFISPYFLIFPATSETPVQFLREQHVDLVAVEGSHLRLPSGFALGETGYNADSVGQLIGRYYGAFNDNHRSYFRDFPRTPDTISLYHVAR